MPSVSSSAWTVFLYSGGASRWWSPEHRAMVKGSPCGGLTATARTSASHRLKSFPLYTPLDLRAIITGESSGGRMESGRFLAAFIHQISDGGPQVTARCSDGVPQGTAGWTNPAKSPQTSGGHPANFNCELNLPDACQMRALSADHRRIFVGFEARIAARSSGDGFFSIGTAAWTTLHRICMCITNTISCITTPSISVSQTPAFIATVTCNSSCLSLVLVLSFSTAPGRSLFPVPGKNLIRHPQNVWCPRSAIIGSFVMSMMIVLMDGGSFFLAIASWKILFLTLIWIQEHCFSY